MMQSSQRSTLGRTPSQPSHKVVVMVDNEILNIGAFLGSGMLAYVIIPGLLVMWDRVLDHMEHSGPEEQKKQ